MSDVGDIESVVPQEQLPGIMGMMTSPGFEQFTRATNPITLGGYGAFRSQNTLMYGGIGDDAGRFRESLRRGRGKFSNYSRGSLVPNIANGPNQFVGGTNIFGRPTKRGRRLLAKQAAEGGKTPMLKSFRKNNLSLDPRRFFRRQGLSEFLASPGRNFYAPNQGGFLASMGNFGAKDNPRFSGGMLGRMGAIAKTESRVARRGAGAAAKMDLNLARIAQYNAPSHRLAGSAVLPAGRSADDMVRAFFAGENISNATGSSAYGSLIGRAASGTGLSIGERRYLMTEGIRGRYSQSFMRSLLTVGGGEEMFTGMGTAAAKTFGAGTMAMTDTAEKLMRPLTNAINTNNAFRMRVANSLGRAVPMTEFGAAQMGKEIIQKGFVETLGYRGAAHAAAAGGGRVALAVGGQALLRAMPGINMIFAADMAYQLAKLGGMAVKGAINFGKDAMKSMQGNINGGMFGTYKDDEVRATSRARGVMAIQNSRLNARSLLGSEGAMMAAHFG